MHGNKSGAEIPVEATLCSDCEATSQSEVQTIKKNLILGRFTKDQLIVAGSAAVIVAAVILLLLLRKTIVEDRRALIGKWSFDHGIADDLVQHPDNLGGGGLEFKENGNCLITSNYNSIICTYTLNNTTITLVFPEGYEYEYKYNIVNNDSRVFLYVSYNDNEMGAYVKIE